MTWQYVFNRQENGDMKNCDYQFRVEDKTVKIFPPGMEKFIEIFFFSSEASLFLAMFVY